MIFHRLLAGAFLVATLACSREPSKISFVLATTTSVHDSGLLAHLARDFRRESGIEIHTLSVGSGKALRLAAAGNADVTITHDPKLERDFVAKARPPFYRPFMFNEFVVVGPRENPAGIARNEPVVDAFRKIASAKSRFCSRSDESGTHARELLLWREGSLDPHENPNYLPLGQSMGALLRSAGEVRCYALSDVPTFWQFSHTIDLVVLNAGDPRLRNVYAVTLMSRDANAKRFAEWLVSPSGRRAIESFTIDGKQLFFPL